MQPAKLHPDVTPCNMILFAVSQQSRHIAIACVDNTVRMVYYNNMQLKYTIKVKYDVISEIYFTKNENYIIVAGNTSKITFISH